MKSPNVIHLVYEVFDKRLLDGIPDVEVKKMHTYLEKGLQYESIKIQRNMVPTM